MNNHAEAQRKLIQRGDRFKRGMQEAAGHMMAVLRDPSDPAIKQQAEDWFDNEFRLLIETDDRFFRLPNQ